MTEVARFAGALQQLGVGKGDTVVIYMPMIPQTVIAMLACARIGAIHSVVFGGFAAHELAIRIDDAQPKVLLTATAGKEVDRVIEYVPIVQAALAEATHPPHACVVYQRDFHRLSSLPDRLPGLAATAQPMRRSAECVELAATDPLYILYTSGTTGRPKGIVRDNGGHAVALKFSMTKIYDIRPGEVFWAASDVGWVVGHSYIVYGPLIHGCTTVLYEGKPVRTPDAGAFWRVVADHDVRVHVYRPDGDSGDQARRPGGPTWSQPYRLERPALPVSGRRTLRCRDAAMDPTPAGRASDRSLVADRVGLADDRQHGGPRITAHQTRFGHASRSADTTFAFWTPTATSCRRIGPATSSCDFPCHPAA